MVRSARVPGVPSRTSSCSEALRSNSEKSSVSALSCGVVKVVISHNITLCGIRRIAPYPTEIDCVGYVIGGSGQTRILFNLFNWLPYFAIERFWIQGGAPSTPTIPIAATTTFTIMLWRRIHLVRYQPRMAMPTRYRRMCRLRSSNLLNEASESCSMVMSIQCKRSNKGGGRADIAVESFPIRSSASPIFTTCWIAT